MKRQFVWHPFLFAIYPVLFLLAVNVDQVALSQAIRPLFITLSLAALLLALFYAATKDGAQAGLTASLILVLFFSYGHVYRVLNQADSFLADHRLLGVVWLLLLTGGMFLKWRLTDLGPLTRFLNTVTAVLLIFPLYTITLFLIQSGGGQAAAAAPDALTALPNGPASPAASQQPDIYYIILDGYGRADVLQEFYQYDNSPFLTFLEERGFFVAANGRSNYNQTSLSLASSLNLTHLNDLAQAQGENSRDRTPLTQMIQESELRRFLADFEYQLVAFDTGYGPTEMQDADIYLRYDPQIINDLENMLLIGSAAVALGDRINGLFNPFLCEVQRGLILNTFDQLAAIPSLPGPQFVFAHIMSPHPPFIFDETGESVAYGGCNGFDGSFFEGTPEEYGTGYARQIAYVNHRLMGVIDQILAESAVPPIIILQGDHGPGLMLDWASTAASCIHERTAVFNAYYLPDAPAFLLYASITPVNSFRVVLNHYFGTDLALLEDTVYFATWDHPYRLVDVSHRLQETCTPP